MTRKTSGQALRKLSHKWAPVKKPTNPEKERSDLWPGLKTALISAKKDKEKLKKTFIFTVKHERILQSKKRITEIWQVVFCLITHLLVTQLAMRRLRQELMLKIL